MRVAGRPGAGYRGGVNPDAPFDVLCEPRDGRIEFPATWEQGRGLFGGLVCAAMIRAAEQQLGPERPLRSFSAEIVGPVQPGEARLRVETLRAGNAVTTASIFLEQGSELLAHAVAVLGKTRMSDRDALGVTPPRPPKWADVEVIPIAPPFGPVFAEHLEFRPTSPLPFSGGTEPIAEGFVRFKQNGARRDAAWLAGLIDAFWPTLFALESAPRPMATLAFTFQPFSVPADLEKDAPLFKRTRLAASEGGYCVENRELWGHTTSGALKLLALNQQTFVIIK